jgi:hypothetical protein
MLVSYQEHPVAFGGVSCNSSREAAFAFRIINERITL